MICHLYNTSRLLSIFICFVFSHLNAQGQTDVFENYEQYIEAPREVVYLHLNKSTYVKGESIGLTAYVLDKEVKRPSMLTTNLYVSIEDQNNNIIKKKLIKVTNGIASNVITVDSLFDSGHYTIKAYTNYMRNFNEHNYHLESIRIIDPEVEKYLKRPLVDNTIDAQFLPESGHLLHGVLNKVGVVIKDSQGYGLPHAEGKVKGKNNEVLTTFRTNELGIASFSLMANFSESYSVKINYANEDFQFSLGHNVERNGVILSIKRLKAKLFASIITNEETLKSIKNKRFTLILHNGSDFETMDIYFTDTSIIHKVIEHNNIPVGTNILTLFNENDIPIAERLFFNYEGINVITSNNISASGNADSLNIKLGFKDINPDVFNNISVSVLPAETQSYNRHHNIISQTFLQPYIHGVIENGKYYFKNIDDKKRYDLDNLLITQGWSSYDWNNLFLPDDLYPFEQGIFLKANVNNQKFLNNVYLLHHFDDSPPQYKQTSDDSRSLIFENLYPREGQSIYISRLQDNSNLVPAQLYLQAIPSEIPRLLIKRDPLLPKNSYKISENLRTSPLSNVNLNEEQILDEVVVESSVDKELVKTRKITSHNFGTVKYPSELDRKTFLFLEDYLRSNRINVIFNAQNQELIFLNGRPVGSVNGGSGMQVFFDGLPLTSSSFLYRYPLANIDHIEIDRTGFNAGARGANGVLRLYSNKKNWFNSAYETTAQIYNMPLAFSVNKTFYVPKYQYYNDDFFKGFGTIDWKPELSIDSNGEISFKILKPKVPITLFIEGITNNGSFVFEEKSIDLN